VSVVSSPFQGKTGLLWLLPAEEEQPVRWSELPRPGHLRNGEVSCPPSANRNPSNVHEDHRYFSKYTEVSNGRKPRFYCGLTPPVIHQPSFNELFLISAGLGLICHNKQGDFYINALSSPCKHTNPVLSLFLPAQLKLWSTSVFLGWGVA